MAPDIQVASWAAFENTVAALYRALGAFRVQQNANLAGNQIDIYVEEHTASGQAVRTAVECKYFRSHVPKDAVVQVANVATLLKHAGLIDKATVVQDNLGTA